MSELVTATAVEAGETSRASSDVAFFPLAALILLTIAAALRFYHLGDRSLWFDEALTANTSRSTLAHMMEATRLRGSAPVVHPLILYVIEKVRSSAVTVRLPSALASLAAVFMMLAMVRTKVSQNAALFAAAILAVSASQIRYAQEVREYSLCVLLATILIYCLLRWETAGARSRHPVLLYAALFLAPLVQYGLVFFGCAILSTIVLRLLFTRDTCFKLSHVVIGSAFFAAGGLLSFILTVRYQIHPGKTIWYLASNYYDPKVRSLPRFLIHNTKELLSFSLPGQIVTVCFVIAAVIFCATQARSRKVEPITFLVCTSIALMFCASAAKLYPYGGIRQCLFLAPGLILFAGVAFANLLQQVRGYWEPLATIAILAIILFSGYRSVLVQKPYAEIEDTRSILRELAISSGPTDQVWVNHDAVEAFDFYQPQRDPRFVYGQFHAEPGEYIPEVSAAINPGTDRIWLVFSHLEQPSDVAEEQLIVDSLRSGWDVQTVIAPVNTELFVANRRASPGSTMVLAP